MTVSLLGLSGSLRAASYNTAILHAIRDGLRGEAVMTIASLEALPLYNEDSDGDPALLAVQAYRDAIQAADGIIIASPEYNYGISGVLKNALDWASRPWGKAPLINKPVLTLSCSIASTGGVRAQAQLNETLLAIGARLVNRGQTVITAGPDDIQNGAFANADVVDFALDGVRHLVTDLERWRRFDAA